MTENTTDTIATHDVYELGEFKDDQMQDHKHSTTIGVANGENVLTDSFASTNEKRYDAYTKGMNTGRTGTTTHGKQKGVTYIIKAFHTNEGVDSGVSDDVVEYVDNKIATKKDVAKLLNNATDSTKWLKLKLGSSSTFQPIIISDQYGGKVEKKKKVIVKRRKRRISRISIRAISPPRFFGGWVGPVP